MSPSRSRSRSRLRTSGRLRAPPAAARPRRSRLPAPRLAGPRALRSAIGRGSGRPPYINGERAGSALSPRALWAGRAQDGGGAGRVRDARRGGCAGCHPLRAAGEGTAGPPRPPPADAKPPGSPCSASSPWAARREGPAAGSARGRCGSKWPRPLGAAPSLVAGQGAAAAGSLALPRTGSFWKAPSDNGYSLRLAIKHGKERVRGR